MDDVLYTDLYRVLQLLQRDLAYPDNCNAVLDDNVSDMSDSSLSSFIDTSLFSGLFGYNSLNFEVNGINERAACQSVVARTYC